MQEKENPSQLTVYML